MSLIAGKKLSKLRILYLDDHQGDIDNFVGNAKRFQSAWNLEVTTTKDFNEAIEMLEQRHTEFDVFVCDHNMPDKMGFDLIKYLKHEISDLIYVLYTSAVYMDENLKKACAVMEILPFIKTEEFGTLIEQILNKLNTPKPHGADEVYNLIADTLVDDLRKLQEIDPHYTIVTGGNIYTANEIINHLKIKTPFGISYIKGYLRGLKYFNSKK